MANTRRGAVSELQARLASEELPVAVGAYKALADLAHTDIRYVAEPAAAALSQAAIRPEETELHFGKRRPGSRPPHRMVRLLGPPIARACTPRASHDWIRVSQTAEGLDISVDTTRTGTLTGTLDLKGPTGDAIIAIDVEILPQAAQTATTRRPSRPAHQPMPAVAIPADQPEAGSAAKARHTKREATEQGGQDATEVARPIRRGAAFTGTVIALLAGLAGLISQVLAHIPSQSGLNFFFDLAIFAVPVAVAVVVLTQIRRLATIGFLQGIWWLAVPALAANIVIITNMPDGITDRDLAAILLRFTSSALGVITAILLMVSWSPAVDRRRPPLRALPVMLLTAAGFSQIAALILYVSQGRGLPYFPLSLSLYIMGSAGVPVVLALTWYAMRLRAHAVGAALVLGWVTIAALTLMTYLTQWSQMTGVERFWGVLECVLLATVVVLTVFYVRGPSVSIHGVDRAAK